MKRTTNVVFALALAFAVVVSGEAYAQDKSAPPAEVKPVGVLKRSELEKLIPPMVFFQGQSATVQLRNSGGVRLTSGALVLTVKVDTGGYSTAVQERYQDYLIAEAPIQLGEGAGAKTLAPGAYGIGFVGDGLIVMDIGGHTLFTVPTQMDKDLRRPSPLQVLAHDAAFRIYSGRSYITFAPAS